MFRKFNNLDTAFRQVRNYCFFIVAIFAAICLYSVYRNGQITEDSHQRIYLLAPGAVLQAVASTRGENLQVEAQQHVKSFHTYFFTLDPDEKVIREQLSRALYLADASARRSYETLLEKGYYRDIIAANISQRISVDSIDVEMGSHPYRFTFHGSQRIIRSSVETTRRLVTMGQLREVSRSANNPHGFLIEGWRTTDNSELRTIQRR